MRKSNYSFFFRSISLCKAERSLPIPAHFPNSQQAVAVEPPALPAAELTASLPPTPTSPSATAQQAAQRIAHLPVGEVALDVDEEAFAPIDSQAQETC